MNLWLYQAHALAMPLAAVLALVLLAFALNMSYGYFVEGRAKLAGICLAPMSRQSW